MEFPKDMTKMKELYTFSEWNTMVSLARRYFLAVIIGYEKYNNAYYKIYSRYLGKKELTAINKFLKENGVKK